MSQTKEHNNQLLKEKLAEIELERLHTKQQAESYTFVHRSLLIIISGIIVILIAIIFLIIARHSPIH